MASNLRTEQKKMTENRIVQAGIRLFSQNGITATSTLQIAKSAGVSHAAIFVHFPTKPDLLKRVIEEIGRKILVELNKINAKSMKMSDLLTVHLAILEEYEEIYARLVVESPQLPVQLRHVFLNLHSGVSGSMERIASRAIQNGEMLAMPTYLLFNTWIGLVYYYIAHRDVFAPGESVIRSKKDELIEHFLNLISTRAVKENN